MLEAKLQFCQLISQRFLCGLPVGDVDLDTVLKYLCDSESGVIHQDALLSVTVDHPLILKLPLKPDYQRIFLRTVIQKLEQIGVEISDKMYSRYCELLTSLSLDGDVSYRHYTILHDSDVISLKESNNLISKGTTGLRTWEASHVLINWCFHHASILEGASILELGSGIGLSGIAISLTCKPSRYWFSDCHSDVLEILAENIALNSGESSDTCNSGFIKQFTSTSLCLENRIIWAGSIKESNVAVLNLPWEDIPSLDIAMPAPSFILASDVVYDLGIFGVLASAFDVLAKSGSQIILASTERNSETLTEFLKLLSTKSLSVEEEVLPEVHVLPMIEPATSIKIHKISSSKP